MSNWRLKTMSARDTQRLGWAIGGRAQRGDLIALFGELGAGKTQLVKGIAAGMGLKSARVSSPTFVFVHEYEPRDSQDAALIHIDAYRLKSSDELDTVGSLEEMRRGNVVVIEWADRVGEALGDDRLELHVSHAGESERIVECRAYGDWVSRMARPLSDDLKPVACPSCGGVAQPGSADYPFCSQRCRLADLNKWFGEAYRISRPIEQTDLDED